MKLYLVRHGEAEMGANDSQRVLTAEGREAVEWIAAWASQADVRPDQIRHSGKARAEQTAQILAKRVEPKDGVLAYPDLSPDDNVLPMAKSLERGSGSIMLVGHLPFLARLAGVLVTGDPQGEIMLFSTGQMVCLEKDDKGWTVAWSISPSLIV